MDVARGEMVECDRCDKQMKKSKMVTDKGTEYPELIKKAKEDDRDHLRLCPLCADVDMVNEEAEGLESEMSNVRQFL